MALFLSPKQLSNIPAEFRSHPLRVKFLCTPFEGLTNATTPIVDAANPDSYAAMWSVSHELEWEPIPGVTETEIGFEIISEQLGNVVGFGEVMISPNVKGSHFREIVKILDNKCGFKGTRLYVEIVQIVKPPYCPKYLIARIDHGSAFVENGNMPAESTTDIYLSITCGETLMGTTKKQRGPTLVWMDSFQCLYNGELTLEIAGFGVNKHGDTITFGSARVNLWEILSKDKNANDEWIKNGELILSPGGNVIEKQGGKLSVTILFRDDYKPKVVDDAPKPGQYITDLGEGENSPTTPVEFDDEVSKDSGAPPPLAPLRNRDIDKSLDDSDSKALSRSDLEDRVKAAQKLADNAETAARAADRAAADADIVARANPSREKDDLANGAEDAAKDARKNADDAASLARAVIDECDRRKPRVESLNKLNDQLRDKVNDALDNRDRAEDDAKAAIKLNAEDLVAKAKEHFAKCADYASQTAKLAESFEDIPKLRSLADGARNDQATAQLAAQDAKADAKACTDAKTLSDAYAAMRDCEAMVRDVTDCEEEARLKWKKANKLVQRRKKAKELEQQQELKKMQEEAEAEAVKKLEQRQRDHELDKAQRRSATPHGDENLAWNYAAAHMSNGSGQTSRLHRGGIFRNFCREPRRSNPEVKVAHSDSSAKGYDHWSANCCIGEKLRNTADDSTRAGDESQLEFDGYNLKPKFCRGGSQQGRSFSGLEEKQYLVSSGRTPWCWCFGCQCCHCCGEC